jgi:hypothetical protein
MGSALDSLLNAPNISEVIAASATSSGSAAVVSFAAPGLLRRKSGAFLVEANFSVTTPGAGAQGVIAQLISSATGNVGPAVPYSMASAAGGVSWVDASSIDVGQTITYSLKLTPISTSNNIALGTNSASLVVTEL